MIELEHSIHNAFIFSYINEIFSSYMKSSVHKQQPYMNEIFSSSHIYIQKFQNL